MAAKPFSLYLDAVSHWRIDEYRKAQGIDSLSATVRDLIKRGWDAHMAQLLDTAAPRMVRGPSRS